MDEYIKRQAALDALQAPEIFNINPRHIELIKNIPAADVAPVVHGRWIADGDGYHWTYNCSICAWKDGYPFNERHNFCPSCGARMDGGDTNA